MLLSGVFLIHSFFLLLYKIYPAAAQGSASQWQSNLKTWSSSSPDWQKYVRSPPTTTVRPSKVLSQYIIGNVKNPDGLVSGNGPTVLTRSLSAAANETAANHSIADVTPSIVVDWGQNIAGFVSITFAGASNSTPGLPGLRLAFSETLQYLTNVSDFSRSDNGDTITPGSDQIAVQSKSYTWSDVHGCMYEGKKVCSDGLHGFRYMKIYMDALPADAPYTTSYGTVSIESMSLAYSGFLGTPNTFTGWIQTSDENLNQWWYDSVYTNDLCIDEFRKNDTDPRGAASPSLIGKTVLHDGAKRDRDPYVGDLAVSAKTAYLTHNIPQAARNVLADLADHQRADGWIPPASINNYTLQLLDYPMWWVVCSYDLYMYTGDTAYVQKYYQTILNVLDKFYPSITNTNTNLLQKGLGISADYGDYGFLPRTGPVTYYNALYVLALDSAASIAKSLAKDTDATRWTDRAKVVSAAINDRLFDDSVGAFFDGSCGFSPCSTHAQDGNSISIVSNAVNGTRASSVLNYLAKANARPYGNSFYDNDLLQEGFSQRVYAFISYFEIEARFKIGSSDTALEEIRRLYGWMTSHDPMVTVWEGIGANGSLYEGSYSSQAHGWATGIVPALTNNVLGVRPTGPGFSAWSIKPIPGDVAWAKGVVPGPDGPISVAWNKFENPELFFLSASAPDGSSGIISVPIGGNSSTVWVNGNEAFKGGVAAQGFKATSGDGYISIEVGGGDHIVTVGFDWDS
ncbi:alpha-L-rhamnosidase A [Tricladium varicosporioides]|nr:alpha-L-rhamnosidase A [Hymenoscyphus varicosporioides]